ncbi:MAG TPA: hypothetical protein VFD70_08180 [Anaerolineae bacterium]|nr:hypothetical protein [Anaerolineae bacterium]
MDASSAWRSRLSTLLCERAVGETTTEECKRLCAGGLVFGEYAAERDAGFGDAAYVGARFGVDRIPGRAGAGALGIIASSDPSSGSLNPSR